MAEETVFSGREKPKFGVRLDRGIVTHWRDVPLTTWELADDCRRTIEELLGEHGEVERVYAVD